MLKLASSIAKTLYRMPFRAWQYGQRFPYEGIVYGVVLCAIALVSKPLLALLALTVVLSGIKAVLEVN